MLTYYGEPQNGNPNFGKPPYPIVTSGLWHHLCISRSALKLGSLSEEPTELGELDPPSGIWPGSPIIHLRIMKQKQSLTGQLLHFAKTTRASQTELRTGHLKPICYNSISMEDAYVAGRSCEGASCFQQLLKQGWLSCKLSCPCRSWHLGPLVRCARVII